MNSSIFKNNIEETWKYRALIWALVVRHTNARYRGSVLGFVWSFLNPVLLIAIYALVFKYYIRFDHVQNYALFLFCGLLPWIWLSASLSEATSSVSGGGSLVTKALFPAHVLPTVSVLTNLVNFMLSVPLLIAFGIFCGIMPGVHLLWLPIIVFFELLFILGLSYMLSALNVQYRDVQHILGNFITFWFFLCPILYPIDVIPKKLSFTLWLNPAALFTRMYQQVFLENTIPNIAFLLLTAAVSLTVFMLGHLLFNRFRDEFAELV